MLNGSSNGGKRRSIVTADDYKVRPLPSPGELKEVQQRFGIVFRNETFLQQAFIHRSYLNEARISGLESNERMEYLGDKVLDFTVAQYLYRQYPDQPEGMLTSFQSTLVNTKKLGEIAESLNLAQYLRMSRGEEKAFQQFQRSRIYILGCVFEAVVGAIYLDRGTGIVELFLIDVLFPQLKQIIEQSRYVDAKSLLQEIAQERLQVTPRYEVLDEQGPDHERQFTIGAFLEDRQVGQGAGFSKQEAQQHAAQNALLSEFQIVFNKNA